MEYVNVDVSYDSNVNYVGSDLRRPGNLLFTDYDGVWTVNKSSNRGNKMSVHRIAVIEPVSYVFFCLFHSQVVFQFKSLYSQGLM